MSPSLYINTLAHVISSHNSGQPGRREEKVNKLTENSRPPALNQLAIGTALEQNGFLAGTLAVSKGADCLGGFVVETGKHLVQVRGTEGEHEPFAKGEGRWVRTCFLGSGEGVQ